MANLLKFGYKEYSNNYTTFDFTIYKIIVESNFSPKTRAVFYLIFDKDLNSNIAEIKRSIKDIYSYMLDDYLKKCIKSGVDTIKGINSISVSSVQICSSSSFKQVTNSVTQACFDKIFGKLDELHKRLKENLKKFRNNEPIKLSNGDVRTSKGIIVPKRFIETIQWMEESPKKQWLNSLGAPLVDSTGLADFSTAPSGIKPSTIRQLIDRGYFPNLKLLLKNNPSIWNDLSKLDIKSTSAYISDNNSILNYIKNNNYEVLGEILGAYINEWKDINLLDDKNFAVLATLYNQGEVQKPHQFPIIAYWGYGMKARNYLYKSILHKEPVDSDDYIVTKTKKINDKYEVITIMKKNTTPKNTPKKDSIFESIKNRFNSTLNKFLDK